MARCRYGHGVLRDPDPRFIALQTFCEVRPELKDSPIINLVKKTAQVAPGVLVEHGKVRVFRLVVQEGVAQLGLCCAENL